MKQDLSSKEYSSRLVGSASRSGGLSPSPRKSSLLRSGAIVAFFTLLSRIFGLARELFIAATFGSSMIADCVNVAFKLPNLFRRVFGEGALSAVFIPIFSKKLVESTEGARKFSTEVFSLLLVTLVAITLLMELLMPYCMVFIAPGFYEEEGKYELAILLCRITTPYLIFVCISALFGGVLNSLGRFAAFAFVPIILNVGVIVFTIIWEYKFAPEYGVSIAVIVAGILQVIFMYYSMWRAGFGCSFSYNLAAYFSRPKEGLSDEEGKRKRDVSKFIKNMGPASISSGAQQIGIFISQSIASFIPGAISILSYADRLYQLPLSLIGISFGTILLPELSKIYKKQDYIKANLLQNTAIQIAMFISIPASVGLIVFSKPIIHIIYERGEFLHDDTIAVASVLSAFSLGLPAYIISKIITPIFYANSDTKTPLKVTIYSLLINITLNIALMIPFGYVGIALGSSISSWINVYLLTKSSSIYGNSKISKETYSFVIKSFCAGVIMGIGIYFCEIFFSDYLYHQKGIYKFASLVLVIVLSIILYLISTFILGLNHKLIQIYRTRKHSNI